MFSVLWTLFRRLELYQITAKDSLKCMSVVVQCLREDKYRYKRSRKVKHCYYRWDLYDAGVLLRLRSQKCHRFVLFMCRCRDDSHIFAVVNDFLVVTKVEHVKELRKD
jgi:hypothetical protein